MFLPRFPYRLSRLPRVAPPGTYFGASTNTPKHKARTYILLFTVKQHDVFLSCTPTMSFSSAEYRKPLCGWSLSVSVCYRLVSGKCCGARLRDVNRALSWCMSSQTPRHCLADGLRLQSSTEGKAPRKFTPILLPSRTMHKRSSVDESSITDMSSR